MEVAVWLGGGAWLNFAAPRILKTEYGSFVMGWDFDRFDVCADPYVSLF
jgi:hypothetical protein